MSVHSESQRGFAQPYDILTLQIKLRDTNLHICCAAAAVVVVVIATTAVTAAAAAAPSDEYFRFT